MYQLLNHVIKWVRYILMSMTCRPMWPFLFMCVSRDTGRIDFLQVDGWSTRHPGFGASQLGIRAKVNDYLGSSVDVELGIQYT